MPKFIILIVFSFISFFVLIPKTYATITFSISNPQINNEEVTFDVSLSGLTSSSCGSGTCYLQAAFTGQSQPRYFGFTKNNNGDWYKYNSNPGQDYIKSTFFSFQPQDGGWSGKLTIKVDQEDQDYSGPGNYDIKAWRYTGNSDSYAGASDNIVTVQLINSAPSQDPSPSPSPSPTPSTPTPNTQKSSPSPKQLPSTAKNISPSPTPKFSPKVLGIADTIAQTDPNILSSPSPTPSSFASPPSTKVAGILIGSGAILIGLAVGFYLWYQRSLQKPQIQKEQERFD